MTIENEFQKETCSTPLSVERLKELIHYDPLTGLFYRRVRSNNRIAGVIGTSERVDGYLTVCVEGQRYLAHRLAWFYIYGQWPQGYIDHINQIRPDNRIENLREANATINNMNRGVQINNILGIKGVKQNGNKFVARITHNRVQHYLGTFDTIEEAIDARRGAEKIYFGEYAPE